MKKYKLIVILLTIIYIGMAVSSYILLTNNKKNQSNLFRVEINRLLNVAIIRDGEVHVSLDDCEYIKRVRYLENITDTYSINKSEKIKQFYQADNDMLMEIVPILSDKNVTGYLRFDYVKETDISSYIYIVEFSLFAIYLISAGILLYINYNIIKPFNRLSNVPYELSKGNLNDEMKESKNRYFGKFVWGIGMLKDVLDVHNRKELKLARDKKMILLSLSHDIKTPLNAISLYAKALEEEVYNDENDKKEAAVKIQEKSKEIDNFVCEIIKSTTEDVVTIEINNSEYYLFDLVKKIKNGYSEKCKIEKLELSIGECENHILKGDIDRMYEVFGNLFENAFKYGDGRKITIKFYEEEYCQLISVYNSGEPVRDNDMAHLFDSFFRGSNIDGKKGNGLGLYICSEIMKKMDGEIFANKHEDGMEFVLVCRMS